MSRITIFVTLDTPKTSGPSYYRVKSKLVNIGHTIFFDPLKFSGFYSSYIKKLKYFFRIAIDEWRIIVFTRLAQQHSQFVKDLVMNLQALAIVLENQGYIASCYTCGGEMNSASFMVSLADNHLIRFLVSDYGITWTEMRDDRELMKLEGAEAISQLQELENISKFPMKVQEMLVHRPTPVYAVSRAASMAEIELVG